MSPTNCLSSATKLPRISSMVFDLEDGPMLEEDGKRAAQACYDEHAEQVAELKLFLQATLSTQKVASEVAEAMMEQQLQGDAHVSVEVLAQSLSRRGYIVKVRRAMGGGPGVSCLRQLRHVFLSALSPGSDRTSFIIDPAFAGCFTIAKPTPRYAAILACLAETVLVIPEERISSLVTFLCSEMQEAFRENQSNLPPWRSASSMLSKWQPRRSMDETITAPRFALPADAPAAAAVSKLDVARAMTCHVVVEPLRVYGGFGNFNHLLG